MITFNDPTGDFSVKKARNCTGFLEIPYILITGISKNSKLKKGVAQGPPCFRGCQGTP